MGQHMSVYEIEWTRKLTKTELEILTEEWGDYFDCYCAKGVIYWRGEE